MFSLDKRRILILGGSSGIGLATAQISDRYGAHVVVASRSEARRKRALATLSANAEGAFVNMAEMDSITSLIESYPKIDAIVFLPAAGGLKAIADMSVDEVKAHFEQSFFAAYQTIKVAVPRMCEEGAITLVTGALSRRVKPECSHIVAAQWAMEGLMRGLIREVAPVRINMVAPGLVDTPFWDALGPKDKAKLFEATSKDIPTGSPAKPDQIAQMIVSTMTNSFMNGATVVNDGGWSL